MADTNYNAQPSSFRDPDGHLFYFNNTLYRQINLSYKDNYDFLFSSSLYNTLIKNGLLIEHYSCEELSNYPDSIIRNEKIYKIIRPEKIPFISYPYEWCFSQLKDAALTTLNIQRIALEHGMTLKDASAYNIQFLKNGKPIFIDTLSFEKYYDGSPWTAYRQFCEHFLAPLSLMRYKDARLGQMLRVYLDGIPLTLTKKLLPFYTYFVPSIFFHVHLHSYFQRYFEKQNRVKPSKYKIKLSLLYALIDNLISTIQKMGWTTAAADTIWSAYYKENNYSPESFNNKKQIVSELLQGLNLKYVWDLGANTGVFSRIAAEKGAYVISFDNDIAAVEINYINNVKNNPTKGGILPLLMDITNPSPSIGWENRERMDIWTRGERPQLVMALALIHHLAISNNLPITKIAEFFNAKCDYLMIEFVPKNDTQVKRLLSTRKDVFPDYTQNTFEEKFQRHFKIIKKINIKNSLRTIYLMKNIH